MAAAFRGESYVPVAGWLALAGTVAGAVVYGLLFGFLIPPDRGEEDVCEADPVAVRWGVPGARVAGQASTR
ncbi:hypothetical protein CSIV_04300 [Microbacterium sp. CSI-V]|nr:hypothetical protein CSIV_04300 [Microbacterium sp. CSI-V]